MNDNGSVVNKFAVVDFKVIVVDTGVDVDSRTVGTDTDDGENNG